MRTSEGKGNVAHVLRRPPPPPHREMRSCRVLGLHVWFAVLQAVALLLFTRGFLLTRVELPDTSRCEDLPFRCACSLDHGACSSAPFVGRV